MPTEGGTDVGIFSYEALDLAQKNIRVIQIKPASTGIVQCQLRVIPLDDAQYVCLSYAWGDDPPIYKILVNGRLFKVRKNLISFLTVARKLEVKEWLWIDAVCINQEDVPERNHQVQHMGEIYRRAKHVILYPGIISNLAGIAIKSISHWYDDEYTAKSLPLFRRSRRRISSALFRPLFASSLSRLLQMDYWKRLWIVQELSLAHRIHIVLGNKTISWDKFARIGPVSLDGMKEQIPPVWSFLRDREVEPRTQCYPKYQSFMVIADYFRSYKCRDVRDRVYGLLSITDHDQSLKVDYGITVGTLFLDILENESLCQALGDPDLGDVLQRLAGMLDLVVVCVCENCITEDIRFSLERAQAWFLDLGVGGTKFGMLLTTITLSDFWEWRTSYHHLMSQISYCCIGCGIGVYSLATRAPTFFPGQFWRVSLHSTFMIWDKRKCGYFWESAVPDFSFGRAVAPFLSLQHVGPLCFDPDIRESSKTRRVSRNAMSYKIPSTDDIDLRKHW